ncbi:AraC family transcriptional regulator [Nocardioides sp. R-C-SC26]|uniref:helix-turn-helix transcriptional regulator n=1 Tax=Nocardioides sp. R-C-SC26 TaxID=2870414 RepID=UPI001E4D9E6B|nr:AraC family transcriptional regulator [Nocardioides sp. R-C-SC26]
MAATTRAVWDHPRRAGGLVPLLGYAAVLGIAPERLLPTSALTPSDVTEGTTEIPARSELQVVQRLVDLGGPRVSGFELGAHYGLSTYGVLGFAISTSRTLQEAIDVGLRFLDLSFAFATPEPTLDGDRVRLVVPVPSGLPDHLAHLLADRDLSAIARLIDESTGGVVELAIDRTGRSITFGAAWLAAPMPRSDPAARARCEAACLDAVSRRRSRTGAAQTVRAGITRHLAVGAPAGLVAAESGWSERTLRRRLAEAGTSYRELLDEVRSSLAEEFLAIGALTVGDIAVRLGYAESASFIHAYRRWTGRSPRAVDVDALGSTDPSKV